jgi:SAM-dependent methyltransferase
MRPAGTKTNDLAVLTGTDLLGSLYERHVAADQRSRAVEANVAGRHRRGIFYTPAPVVDFIVDQTLRPLVAGMAAEQVRRLRILDPACGCGAFLLGAYRWLCGWYEVAAAGLPLRTAQRRAIARRQLAGIDIDATAVKLAREAIGTVSGLRADELTKSIRYGDALLHHDEWLIGRFDAVVANPPYVNIRRLTKGHGASTLDALRRRYGCARGAFDLYVLFLERSVAALRRGGRIGAIVPNKLATLDYARPCRELLLQEGTLDAIVDVSDLRIFAQADVYPYILLWTKRPATRDHAITVVRPSPLAKSPFSGSNVRGVVDCRAEYRVPQSQQSSRGWTFGGDLDVEAHVATEPLAEVCTIHSGATGFQAAELAARLVEASCKPAPPHRRTIDFIVSGNIDRYRIRVGHVRFMGRQLVRPRLAIDDPILTDNKRRLYAGSKIVLAGMVRRLEAAFDTRGLALGVQVYALTNWKVDPLYLLAVLNSSLMSHLFRLRFPAKRLAGGYFSMSKGQLGQLPIRCLNLSDQVERRKHELLVKLVRQRLRISDGLKADAGAVIDAQIDQIVLELYGVAAKQLASFRAAA